MSASAFGSMMATMQMTKMSRAWAVPLKLPKDRVNARTVMSERPVCLWNQQIQLKVSKNASHKGPAR